MNLQQIREQKKEVRILSSNNAPNDTTREMIGGVFEVRTKNYEDETMTVWDKDKTVSWHFNFSDTQPLIPLSHNRVRIGIGDEVRYCGNWHEVHGYSWYNGKWNINIAKNKDYEDCSDLLGDEIEAHRPLYKNDEVEKAIQLLKDKGLLKKLITKELNILINKKET